MGSLLDTNHSWSVVKKIKKVNEMGKNVLLLLITFLMLIACSYQSIDGKWDRFENGGKITLNFQKGILVLDGTTPDGEYFPSAMTAEYHTSNNILRFLNDGGTGVYAEPSQFEYKITGNTMVLIALNASARFTLLEGRYTRTR